MQNVYGQLLSRGGRNQMYDTMGQAGSIAKENNDRAMMLALGAGGNPADVYSAARKSADESGLNQQQYINSLNQQAVGNQMSAAQGMQGLPDYMLAPTKMETAFLQGVKLPAETENARMANEGAQYNTGQQNQAQQFNIQSNQDYQKFYADLQAKYGTDVANLLSQSYYAYEQPSGFDQYIAPLLGLGGDFLSAYGYGAATKRG